ncbi:MAG: putative rRNA maturation factor [Patescibacteria group bacterium]|jgi:probable rRNA maturation factor|nr:putative rRNA maturation factor [Patescibacteria group bacterium]
MQIFEKDNLEIKRMTKGKLPSLPFVRIKEEIIGKDYELSITFVNKKTIEDLSLRFKKNKDHKNILSFPITKNSGEIILNLETIRIEAKNFDKKYINYLGFLVIHGILHLKGMTHGSKMESMEKKFVKMFNL